MPKRFKVNKEKCLGCGICMVTCPGATELKEDGKAMVIDQEKLRKCGGEDVCPYGAIEKISNNQSE